MTDSVEPQRQPDIVDASVIRFVANHRDMFSHDPLGVFTDEFLLLIADDQNTACAGLAEALNLLAGFGLLRVTSPDAIGLGVSFDKEVTSVIHDGNVRLKCE